MLDEAVVLLGRSFGEGLEPVGAVCNAQLHCPALHALGHLVGSLQVKFRAVVDDVAHFLIDVGRQVFGHFLAVEDVLGKEFAGSVFAIGNLERLFLESLFDEFESQDC